MQLNLHSYQQDALRHILSNPYAGLFLPPGLGKTAITLKAINIIKQYEHINNAKFLIIAPMRVCQSVWPAEIKKWNEFRPLNYTILHGPNKDILLQSSNHSDILLINPEGLKWLFSSYPHLFTNPKQHWMLICDESTLFKNHDSMRFKLLKKALHCFKRRLIMTGTPVPNGLLQLWPQMFIVDKGQRLGAYVTHYRNKYFEPIPFNPWGYSLKPNSEQKIYAAISDIVMHKSNDELDLPPIVYNNMLIQLPSLAIKLYKELKKQYISQYNEQTITASTAATLGMKLKQIANGFAYTDNQPVTCHNAKIDVTQILAESLQGRPLLILYEFIQDLQMLRDAFPNAPYIGGGSTDLRTIINEWNAGNIPILFMHPRAGGHGLNLQDGGCHDVLWYSLPFDLELYMQSNARVHRQGVKNSVTIHHLIAEGTIDSHVINVLCKKDTLQASLLNALLR
jgi:SNF2 family DNA or RNA helicase